MTKITTEHLARNACVYIRQSTADQLAHNHESRRRQYGLLDRAKQLGWSNVEVIDDDLGRSGGGIARPGFGRRSVSLSASNWWRSVLIWSAPGCIPLQPPQRASVSFARHSRRSSCAGTA